MKPAANVPFSFLLPNWVHAPAMPMMLANEIRAVFPTWGIVMLPLVWAWLAGVSYGNVGVLAVYAIGCNAIGSILAGHDFMHRTLGLTLSLPYSRERLWRMRLMIALVGCAPLAVLAIFPIPRFGFLNLRDLATVPWSVIVSFILVQLTPFFMGVFVAPWLTLACRSPLAGTVFSLSMPFVAEFLISFLPGSASSYRWQAREVLLLAVCVFGAVEGRRRFLRLEMVEPGRRVRNRKRTKMKAEAETAAVRSRSLPVWWVLAKKELRLTSIASIPGITLLLTLAGMRVSSSQQQPDVILGVAGAWAALTCIVVGATGSAEERQLGTSEWQASLPLAHWKQWMIKMTVLFGTALFLAVLLPLLVHSEFLNEGFWAVMPRKGTLVAMAISLVTVSVYVSSFCRTSMSAILLSIPIASIATAFLSLAGERYQMIYFLWNRRGGSGSRVGGLPGMSILWDQFVLFLPGIIAGILFVLLHKFAMENHFSAERGGRARQFGAIAMLLFFEEISVTIFYINAVS